MDIIEDFVFSNIQILVDVQMNQGLYKEVNKANISDSTHGTPCNSFDFLQKHYKEIKPKQKTI
jgi:hypothetical protein